MGISAVILSKNEADRIERCIKSVIDMVDEVIVIDSGSTDETVTIALSLGARVEVVDWLGFGKTKNLGHKYANNDWILSIDSDEWLSEELARKLSDLDLKEGTVYSIRRSNIYLGKQIKYSGWSNDWVDRIFHKSEVSWNDNLVHEKLIIPQENQKVRLSSELMHDSYRSVADHKSKTEKYAKLKAKSWVENGKSPSLMKRWFGASFKAFHSYVIKFGFLDGKEGKQIATMNHYLISMQLKYYDELKSKDV